MSKILHVINFFDPAGAGARYIEQLKLHSKHEHEMWVRVMHPLQRIYQYKQVEHIGNIARLEQLLDWCDAIIYHFKGWRGIMYGDCGGPFNGPDRLDKPAAFRSINVRYEVSQDKFWTEDIYNAIDGGFERYSMFSGCHVGAADFLPKDRPFIWTPDLTPIDGAYAPDWTDRPPCVSFIKHAHEFSNMEFPGKKLLLHNTAHHEVMARRRKEATVIIDNVSDGHYGLSGSESILMGLPTIVYNHPKTVAGLVELTDGAPSPFYNVEPTVKAAAEMATHLLKETTPTTNVRRKETRAWAEKYFNPKFLIDRKWDPFCDQLVKS